MQGFKEFLKNLQHADDRTKRRWLFSVSGIVIIIIIVIWINYMHVAFPTLQGEEVTSSTIPIQNKNDSFGKIFMRGFSRIKNDATTQWDVLKKDLKNIMQNKAPATIMSSSSLPQ